MPITREKRRIIVPGFSPFIYRTTDETEFDTLQEAIEYETLPKNQPVKEVVPEQIWTIQQAINMAIAENRVVRFETRKSNAEIKKEIVDIKNCKLMKPDKNSTIIAVIPPSVNNYVF